VETQRKLEGARTVRDSHELSWRNKLAQIDTEEELALQELEMKWREARDTLDAEWKSEKWKAKFNKPSPTLIDRRRTAKRLLAMHRYEESAVFAREIADLEEAEAEDAARRMVLAYRIAIERVDKRFRNDWETLKTSFLTRRSQIERGRHANMLPLVRKVDKYQTRGEMIDEKKRRYQSSRAAAGGKRREIPEGTTIAAKAAKLRLPEIQAAKRTSLMGGRAGSVLTSRKRSASSAATGRQSSTRLFELSIM
jgi:hypothetical protein